MCELARSTHKNQSYFYILVINHWKLKLGWGATHVNSDSSETNEIGLNPNKTCMGSESYETLKEEIKDYQYKWADMIFMNWKTQYSY